MQEEGEGYKIQEEEDLSQDEIIKQYTSLRRVVQKTMDLLVENLEAFMTHLNFDNAKMILCSIGTDQITTELLERYQYMIKNWRSRTDESFEEHPEVNGFVLVYLLEKIFTSILTVYPKNDEIAELVKNIKSLQSRITFLHGKVDSYNQEIEERDKSVLNNLMTEDQAREHNSKEPETNKSLKKRYKDQIEDLVALSHNQEIQENDMDLLTGHKSYLEAVRDVQIIPKIGEIFAEGYRTGQEIAQVSIDKFDKDMEQGFDKAMVIGTKSLLRLRKCFLELDELPTMRKRLYESVFNETFIVFFRHIIESDQKLNNCSLSESANRILSGFLLEFGNTTDYQVLQSLYTHLFDLQEFLNVTRDELEKNFTSEEDPTQEELDDLFDEVIDLFSTRLSPEAAKEIGSFIINSSQISVGQLQHLLRTDSLPIFSLDIENYEFSEKAHLFLSINRFTGEINILKGHISLEEFLSPITYKQLKKELYKYFIEILRESNEDMPEIIPRKISIDDLIRQTADAAAEIIKIIQPKRKHEKERKQKKRHVQEIEQVSNKRRREEGWKRRQIRAKKRETELAAKKEDCIDSGKLEIKETIEGKKVLILVGHAVTDFEAYKAGGDENSAKLTTVECAHQYKHTPNGNIKNMLSNYDAIFFMISSMDHSSQNKIRNNIPSDVYWEYSSLGPSGLKEHLKNLSY